MNNNLNEIMLNVNSFLPVISVMLMAFVTYWLVPLLKSKLTGQQLQKAYGLVKIAVNAAEQIKDVASGDEKKLYVYNYIKSKGIIVDEKDLNNMIESAVLELKKGDWRK